MHNAFSRSSSARAFSIEEEILMDQNQDLFEGPNLENHREGDDDCGCHACTGIGFDPRTPAQKARDAALEKAREDAQEMRENDKLSWESQNSFEEWGDPEFDSSEEEED